MSATRPGQLLRHLHPADPDDGPLLARFAGRRDPAAFEALVRRHGPMVLAVCRRLTGHPQDAEDAFQAAFLVLARSAGSVRNPERLGSWLYGVAVKVAGRARRTALRRRRREVTVAAFPDVPAPEHAPPSDAGPALHEELAALPAHHREPIVLCDLQGLSRTDAAKALGIAEGTLSSRLANGRKRLAERLTRRGVALAAAAVPGSLADGKAAVPDELVSNTCGLAAAWAAGAPLPAAVVRLARGGFPMRGVLLGGFLTLSLAAGAALAAAGLADPPAPQPADPPRPPDPPAAVAAAQPDAKPAPKEGDEPPVKFGSPRLTRMEDVSLRTVSAVAWSPDRAWLAVAGTTHDEAAAGPAGGNPFAPGGARSGPNALVVLSADGRRAGGDPAELPRSTRLIGFASNSRELLTETSEGALISGAHYFQRWEVEVRRHPGGVPPEKAPETVRVTPVAPEPADETAVAVAPGIASYEVNYLVRDGDKTTVRERDTRTGKVRTLGSFTGKYGDVRFTPRGRMILAWAGAGVIELYHPDGKRAWASEPAVKLPEVKLDGKFGSKGGFSSPARPPVGQAVAVSEDGGRILLARGRVTPVLVLDGETGKALPPLEGLDPADPLGPAALSGDGRLAALAYSPLVRLDPKEAAKGNPSIPGFAATTHARGPAQLTVWDTSTGKVVRTWAGRAEAVAFNPSPSRPVLAVLEANGGQTRVGFWEFPQE